MFVVMEFNFWVRKNRYSFCKCIYDIKIMMSTDFIPIFNEKNNLLLNPIIEMEKNYKYII